MCHGWSVPVFISSSDIVVRCNVEWNHPLMCFKPVANHCIVCFLSVFNESCTDNCCASFILMVTREVFHNYFVLWCETSCDCFTLCGSSEWGAASLGLFELQKGVCAVCCVLWKKVGLAKQFLLTLPSMAIKKLC